MDSNGDTLIHSLQHPRLFDHPVSMFEVIETHISWVLLTGKFAYKIKKPVNLGFLDFTTLARRKHFCEEELRLNRRLAPQFYLEVVPICGSVDAPQLRADGKAIEYAVKMQQFPATAQLDRIATAGQLLPRHIDTLADTVANFHAHIAVADKTQHFGEPPLVLLPLLENFDQLDRCCTQLHDKETLSELQYWSTTTHTRLTPLLLQRKSQGYVRETHGDMHLGNMFLWQDKVMVFDCIEFNPELRWIDTFSDIAFLTMDLRERKFPALAQRFLDRYLQHTGDYTGLALLNFYQLYRATVRAKVACIRLHQPHLGESQQLQIQQDMAQYLLLAQQFSRPTKPALLITHGVSGSGKTYLTQSLVESINAIRLRSDIERQRLIDQTTSSTSTIAIKAEKYSDAVTELTYKKLAELARTVIMAGYTVIVDATFLSRARRDVFARLAHQLNVPFLILNVHAHESTLHARIAARAATGLDASEADHEVLAKQLESRESLTTDELPFALDIDSEAPGIETHIVHRVLQALVV